jgi:hypothetical protein
MLRVTTYSKLWKIPDSQINTHSCILFLLKLRGNQKNAFAGTSYIEERYYCYLMKMMLLLDSNPQKAEKNQ